jgi:cysteine desulfuration protein SufE|tara:strand:- start:1736 stop:2134 length:399 start_codon:yes stop_codon:yes gene_type:complete
MNKIQTWSEELEMFDDVMDQYALLIDLAKQPTTLPSELRSDERLVSGCISSIWIDVGKVDNKTKIYYDSDALITKGVTHVICDCFDDMPIDDAKQIKKTDFEALNLEGILSANRRNGLSSLISTLQTKVAAL